MAVSSETNTAIWNAIHDSARWGRYYRTLAGRYRRQEKWVRAVLLASVVGSITTLVAAMPALVQALVGGLVGAAVIFDIVKQPSQTAAALALIGDECDHARIALDELWRDLATIGEEEARRRFDSLNRHLAHVTSMATNVPEDQAVNKSSSVAALQELDSLRESLVRARAEAHGN
ncbi:MAG: hypothetical protein OXH04_14495 [Acidobacteria bacterium]|nr:hypothetical protein [Acidobacteriota bacterium]